VVVITGATSGIGQVAAARLTAMGARIVMIARDSGRAQATLARLKESSREHSVHYADLSVLKDMKRVAAEIAAAEPRIDVLINNAGAIFGSRQLTEGGLELTFALNHVAYFVLTHGLRERLLASASARVVNTASDAHRGNRLDFDDLQSARDYSAFKVYGRTKLCNILFTRELARRFQGTGVTANSLHPGFVNTRFGDESGGAQAYGIRVAKVFALSPEKGAETLIYLASSPEVASTSGEYFYKCRSTPPSREAQDDECARRLWAETAQLAGVDTN
jgi:NAD(P)-dependent dehydrogenase (short-subunit alcohol dehydrogenase family)